MRIFTYLNAVFHVIIVAMGLSVLIVFMYTFTKRKYEGIKFWCKFESKVLGMKLDFKGELHEDTQILIINHQSMLDILAVESATKRHLAWVSKEEITNLFWLGHINKAPKQITIRRGDPRALQTLIKEAKDRIAQNRVLCIFPEGTRTRGVKMIKFKGGSKILCEKLNLKVQPCVVIGTNHVFDSKRLVHSPGKSRVVFLPPVDTSKDGWYDDIQTTMHKQLAKELKELGYA